MVAHIEWPDKFLPGTTDNYISNEVIVKVEGLTAEKVWPFLVDCTMWDRYYDNASKITPPSPSKHNLDQGDSFSFSTFGFPPLQSECLESVKPTPNTPGRLAWRAWQDGDEDEAIDVYHAWLIEDLEGGRVRVLTQESQIGKPAAQLAATRPSPMLVKHQDWLDGLIDYAKKHNTA